VNLVINPVVYLRLAPTPSFTHFCPPKKPLFGPEISTKSGRSRLWRLSGGRASLLLAESVHRFENPTQPFLFFFPSFLLFFFFLYRPTFFWYPSSKKHTDDPIGRSGPLHSTHCSTWLCSNPVGVRQVRAQALRRGPKKPSRTVVIFFFLEKRTCPISPKPDMESPFFCEHDMINFPRIWHRSSFFVNRRCRDTIQITCRDNQKNNLL